MATKKRTVSVRVDLDGMRRLKQAAKLTKQSSGAFLGTAGEARARQVLLEWSLDRYRRGEDSLSHLASQTGLSVEEIVEAAGTSGKDEALAMFLASCRTVAETQRNPEFLRLGKEAVTSVRGAKRNIE